MPRGVSRSKHPELYANQSKPAATGAKKIQKRVARSVTKTAGVTGQRGGWGTRQARSVQGTQTTHSVRDLTTLHTHLASLLQMNQANFNSEELEREISETLLTMRKVRTEIYGSVNENEQEMAEDSRPLQAQTSPPTQISSGQPPFVPATQQNQPTQIQPH